MNKSDFIFGIRTVIEAIEAGKSIDKVLIKKDLNGELARELFAKINELNFPRNEDGTITNLGEKYGNKGRNS